MLPQVFSSQLEREDRLCESDLIKLFLEWMPHQKGIVKSVVGLVTAIEGPRNEDVREGLKRRDQSYGIR